MEIGRRRIRDRIRALEKRVEKLSKQRDIRRQRRRREGIPVLSIIGYTNAGKSTLLNALTNSDVEAANKLFMTLDPTSRRLRFPRQGKVIITDTVGFIADLPEDLIVAFRATLEELADADLLLHVIDAADPQLRAAFSTFLPRRFAPGFSRGITYSSRLFVCAGPLTQTGIITIASALIARQGLYRAGT